MCDKGPLVSYCRAYPNFHQYVRVIVVNFRILVQAYLFELPVSTHFDSMAAPAPLLALGTKKDAICKKGVDHSDPCGHAHKTRDVDFPARFNWRMWNCTAHIPKGHAGIDRFVGQAYTAPQYDRVVQAVHSEKLRWTAVWARMFGWFNGYGDPNEYIADLDFGLYDTLERHSEMIFSLERMDLVKLGTCSSYRFTLPEDENGRTLQERMG